MAWFPIVVFNAEISLDHYSKHLKQVKIDSIFDFIDLSFSIMSTLNGRVGILEACLTICSRLCLIVCVATTTNRTLSRIYWLAIQFPAEL